MGRYKKRPMDRERVIDAMCETVFLLERERIDRAMVHVTEDDDGYYARRKLPDGLLIVARFTARMLTIDIGKGNGDVIDWMQGTSPQEAVARHRARLKPALPLTDDGPVVFVPFEQTDAQNRRSRAAEKALREMDDELRRLHNRHSLISMFPNGHENKIAELEEQLREAYERADLIKKEWRETRNWPVYPSANASAGVAMGRPLAAFASVDEELAKLAKLEDDHVAAHRAYREHMELPMGKLYAVLEFEASYQASETWSRLAGELSQEVGRLHDEARELCRSLLQRYPKEVRAWAKGRPTLEERRRQSWESEKVEQEAPCAH